MRAQDAAVADPVVVVDDRARRLQRDRPGAVRLAALGDRLPRCAIGDRDREAAFDRPASKKACSDITGMPLT